MSDTCSPKKAGKPSMILFSKAFSNRPITCFVTYFHRQSVKNLSSVWFCRGQNFFMLIDEKRQPRDAFHSMTLRRFGPNCAFRLLNLQQQPIIPILF